MASLTKAKTPEVVVPPLVSGCRRLALGRGLNSYRGWQLRRALIFLEDALGLGRLDLVVQFRGFMIVTQGLGKCEAGARQEERAHREVSLHGEVDRREPDAGDHHEKRDGE
jgi:hypothetical protein